jgi:hypothetical protein
MGLVATGVAASLAKRYSLNRERAELTAALVVGFALYVLIGVWCAVSIALLVLPHAKGI